jgi:hypothetical protein
MEIYVLMILKTWKSTIKALTDLVSVESLFLRSQITSSCCIFAEEGVRELSKVSFKRVLIPFMWALSSLTVISQSLHLLISHFGPAGVQHVNFKVT